MIFDVYFAFCGMFVISANFSSFSIVYSNNLQNRPASSTPRVSVLRFESQLHHAQEFHNTPYAFNVIAVLLAAMTQ